MFIFGFWKLGSFCKKDLRSKDKWGKLDKMGGHWDLRFTNPEILNKVKIVMFKLETPAGCISVVIIPEF
ncbi:MAG: hypothetical protein FVQ80_12790 [Planctomycetes bacterium]|nr:hypothetical protein [Planctomycetota bacterium]